VAAGLLALAGCGSTKSGYTAVGDEEATKSPSTVRSSATIEMKGISFSPPTVRLRPGATVTWVNRDKVEHTVTQGTNLYYEFDSGPVEPGRTYKKTFNTEQEIGYRCTIHPNMQGTLIVRKQ
jgi:plastocyanin